MELDPDRKAGSRKNEKWGRSMEREMKALRWTWQQTDHNCTPQCRPYVRVHMSRTKQVAFGILFSNQAINEDPNNLKCNFFKFN